MRLHPNRTRFGSTTGYVVEESVDRNPYVVRRAPMNHVEYVVDARHTGRALHLGIAPDSRLGDFWQRISVHEPTRGDGQPGPAAVGYKRRR